MRRREVGLPPTISRDPDVADRRCGDGYEPRSPATFTYTFTYPISYTAQFAIALHDAKHRIAADTFRIDLDCAALGCGK